MKFDVRVGIAVLLFVIANWGGVVGNPADVNRDNTVKIANLLALIASWGACSL